MVGNLLARVVPFVVLGVASGSSCVWTNGNPQIVAPIVEGNIVSAPALPAEIAWSARVAPTPEQAADLESLRVGARAHRLASPAVREAEHAACAGLSDDDRDTSPFFYRGDIVDVQPLRAPDGALPGRFDGAVVTFRRVEGLTAKRLQHMMDCQIARDAALEYGASETRWCPLAVRSVLAHVELGEHGLDVRLAAADPDAAAETYVRAVALLDER